MNLLARPKFQKISAHVHPDNAAFLQRESARKGGPSVSAIVNDAVTIMRRMSSGKDLLGGR